MGHDDIPALSLVFNPRIARVPGEVLQGEVHLYFPTLLSDNIEEVHLKLRGSVVTKITRQQGQNQVTRRQREDLARETVSLWQKGGAYPPPDSHTLVLPFRFQLPSNLPPSCSFGGYHWSATIGYALEAVGERSGLHFNRREFASFPVLPANPEGAGLRSFMTMEGWHGGWTTLERRAEIRRGIWGDYSEVKAILVLPALEAFPIQTPIPFSLNIVTITKAMKQDDIKEGEPIFPAPPTLPKDLEFEMNRRVYVYARGWSRTSDDSAIARLGGFGESIVPQYSANVQFEPMDKVWIPSQDSHDEKKRKGQWKQETTVKSVFVITQPPAFSTTTINTSYSAELRIDFPGIGNDLKFKFPLNVISCVAPPGTQGWDGPPPEPLDLPPSYFASADWHHDDEKGDE
ncbi:hypothetical protein PHLGIDRAFT_22411 [Phlebiopsis gigantea 11061_1 CR5-6]|uniref:Arrestin-like N-terminal domain-containing protein n=1 Tax=Phlebiopsis gigantea (strain 11061_1 CR5-6) TaxID=745531 RepID=A0A0C3SBP2_PHLG1|nr:hypothetical protein PHLGIDRAFT_22411 [Phlebiopsis gigantea 11061_1 CR5-6]